MATRSIIGTEIKPIAANLIATPCEQQHRNVEVTRAVALYDHPANAHRDEVRRRRDRGLRDGPLEPLRSAEPVDGAASFCATSVTPVPASEIHADCE